MKLTHRLRTVAATALLTVAGCSAALAMASSSLAADTSTKAPRAVQCRINFQASSLNLLVGKDLVLSWTAVGATKLTASWTTGFVPFVGAVTTTMTNPGTYSYQVTGTANGLYCGGAGVQVKFTGSTATVSTTPTQPAPSGDTKTANATVSSTPDNGAGSSNPDNGGEGATSSAGTTSNGGGGGGGDNGGTGNGGGGSDNSGGGGAAGVVTTAPNGTVYTGNGVDPTSTKSGSYPIQSPTSGTGVAWYQDPLHLLAISALALIGSLLLWRREQLRAVFVRRH